jgi:hypothetical protein
MRLAESCAYCEESFENWVSGKISNHISKHIENGDIAKEIPKEDGEPRWANLEKLEKY